MLYSMRIREATAADWPAMWPLMRETIEAGETYALDRDMSEERARSYWMDLPDGRVLVATDADGTVMGTAKYHANFRGPAAHIANAAFMVDPAYAGRGVGRVLAEYVIAAARDDGFRGMQFNAVVSVNTRAVALWRSLGFTVLATIPEGFHHPTQGYVGLHIMYRPLSA